MNSLESTEFVIYDQLKGPPSMFIRTAVVWDVYHIWHFRNLLHKRRFNLRNVNLQVFQANPWRSTILFHLDFNIQIIVHLYVNIMWNVNLPGVEENNNHNVQFNV